MNILFLTPYPRDTAPSQRYRFEQYYAALEQAGMRDTTRSFWDERGWEQLYQRGGGAGKLWALIRGLARRKWLMLQLGRYDVIFIHREVAPIGPPVFEWFMAKVLKKKIIYDFDDAIWLPNTSAQNSIAGRLKWHSKVATICRWSWKVSAGNAYLADYARHYCRHVEITPTVVDTTVHRQLRDPQFSTDTTGLVIGWTGSHSTLKYLQPLVPILQRLEKKHRLTVMVIADKDPGLPLNHYAFVRWSKPTEVEDLCRIDIGLMPLEDDQWSRGKCGFKAIQYGAIGIPALVSPVGVNAEIVQHGVTGYHCRTEADWEAAIDALMADPTLRSNMGAAGRDRIVKAYSVAATRAQFVSLFRLT